MTSSTAVIAALKAYSKPSKEPPDYEALIALAQEETDRSAVIILTSMVEDVLAEVLIKNLKGANGELRANLLDWNGPLGAFSARIKIARAFEIIEQATYRDLDDMREMRNACAHCPKPISFEVKELRAALIAMCDRSNDYSGFTVKPLKDGNYKRALATHASLLVGAIRYGSRKAALDRLSRVLARQHREKYGKPKKRDG